MTVCVTKIVFLGEKFYFGTELAYIMLWADQGSKFYDALRVAY